MLMPNTNPAPSKGDATILVAVPLPTALTTPPPTAVPANEAVSQNLKKSRPYPGFVINSTTTALHERIAILSRYYI